MNTNKNIPIKKYPKKSKKKPKYRFYEVGFYGSNSNTKIRSMLVQDVDNNSFFL